MAINETTVTGRVHRVLLDKAQKLWQKTSFWTKGSDVECDDGNTAENKIGAIKGITTDVNTTEPGYAADMTTVAQLYSDMSVRYNPLTDYIQAYYNGSWKDAVLANLQAHETYLYNKGFLNSDLIGDFVALPLKMLEGGSGAEQIRPDITRASLSITITNPPSSYNGNYTQGSIWTAKAIDLTNYKKIKINVINYNSSLDARFYLAKIYNSISGTISLPPDVNSVGVHEYDISGMTGLYYISLYVRGANLTFNMLCLE